LCPIDYFNVVIVVVFTGGATGAWGYVPPHFLKRVLKIFVQICTEMVRVG